MAVFPHQRHRDIQEWIPEEDIAGIDTNGKIVSDCENVEFENAFIRNLSVPQYVNLPAEVDTYIESGYELLSVKDFEHTERGKIRFFLLYKELLPPVPDPEKSFDHSLKFIIEDGTSEVKELNPDEQNSDITFGSKPTNISYAESEDQLKINLNIVALYNNFSGRAIANFTLIYISYTKIWQQGLGQNIPTRYNGWYLFPRWLGWSLQGIKEDTTEVNELISHDSSLGDSTGGHNIIQSYTNITHDTTWVDSGGDAPSEGGAKFNNSFDGIATYGISNIDYASSIKFWWHTAGGTESPYSYNLQFFDSNNFLIQEKELPHTDFYQGWRYRKYDIPKLENGIKIIISTMKDDGIDAWIDEITIDYKIDREWALIGLNDDGQRYHIESGNRDSNPLAKVDKIIVPKEKIDWRIKKFELYIQSSSDSNILLRYYDFFYSEGSWNDTDKEITFDLSSVFFEENPTDTLNFNYGLGYSISVLPVDVALNAYGRLIYDEVYFRNRSYTVKNDEKVYQSHISGAGRGQPDSFPYNEAILFGFFQPSGSDNVKALALTSLDEMLVLTNKRAVVYHIQVGKGTVYRKRKYVNGSYGITSMKSLVKELDGLSSAEVLFWADAFGLNIYGGGVNPPKRITAQKLENYYNDIAQENKNSSIAFFHKAKNEFWLQVGNIIIVYNLSYNEFKKHKFPYKLKEFVGEEDNIPIVLTDGNRLVKFDPRSTDKFEGTFTLHYNSNTDVDSNGKPFSVSAMQDKILQDLYVTLNKISSPGFLRITIIADGNEIDEVFFKGDELRDAIFSPLLVRYGRIKFKINLSGDIHLDEFGYGFTLPDHPYVLGKPKAVVGVGTGSGKG